MNDYEKKLLKHLIGLAINNTFGHNEIRYEGVITKQQMDEIYQGFKIWNIDERDDRFYAGTDCQDPYLWAHERAILDYLSSKL